MPGQKRMTTGEAATPQRLTPFHLDPREREISTGPFIDLRMTPQLHNRRLRCWAGAPVKALLKSGFAPDAPVWMHTSVLLSVSYGPKLQGPPHEVEAVPMGQSVQLTCHVEANPPALVTWYHYRSIHVVNRHTLAANPNISGLFTPTVISHRLIQSFVDAELSGSDFKKLISAERYSALSVKTRSVENYGLYVCVGLAAQRETRKVVILAEAGPPQIDTQTHVSGRVGGRSRIACRTVGLPKPTPQEFLWSRVSTKQPITPSLSVHIEHEEDLAGSTSALEINPVSKEHFGLYNCTVVTAFGVDSTVIAFKEIKEVPYAFAVGVGAASVVSVIFAAVILWILRRFIRHKRSGRTARIITANYRHDSVDAYSERISTLGRRSVLEEPTEVNLSNKIHHDGNRTLLPLPMQPLSTCLIRSPCHLVSYEGGSEYTSVTGSPIISRLRDHHGSVPGTMATIYQAAPPENDKGDFSPTDGPSDVVSNSRLALLTACSANFRDQLFPT
ncbi:unnamed protein product [Mesocestoides corti]|uniref:Ig-like domain-containing protein n=1 Tax=Mesocestoides corti TaxID=53468 RepID=A0A158QT40_MESCO|nr:unnamed protein product [Mesocestoides corti]